MTDCTCGAPLDAAPDEHSPACPEWDNNVMVLDEFEAIVFCGWTQRQADEMEQRAEAGATVDRLNAKLAGLPPEREWLS